MCRRFDSGSAHFGSQAHLPGAVSVANLAEVQATTALRGGGGAAFGGARGEDVEFDLSAVGPRRELDRLNGLPLGQVTIGRLAPADAEDGIHL